MSKRVAQSMPEPGAGRPAFPGVPGFFPKLVH